MLRRIGRVRFGPFEADLSTCELRRDGVPVPLQQQPFRLLSALLLRPGELVTRDELRATIWPEGTYVDFERGLTVAVRKVRAAVGDRARPFTYIETLPGRGYRFVGPVDIAHDASPFVHDDTRIVAAPPGAGEAAVALAPSRAPWRSAWRLGLVAAVVVLSAQPVPPRTDAADRRAAADALAAYACLLKGMGRMDDSLAAIERAHALVPASAKLTAEVGFYRHAAKRYDEEFPMYWQAIRQDPASPDAWLHLGLGFARRENFADAVEALQRADALSAGGGRARFWLDWARAQSAATHQIESEGPGTLGMTTMPSGDTTPMVRSKASS